MNTIARAKFRCLLIAGKDSQESRTIRFDAVTTGEENKSWSKWTPAGTLTMTITNPDAFNHFVEGKEYYLDFIPVEE